MNMLANTMTTIQKARSTWSALFPRMSRRSTIPARYAFIVAILPLFGICSAAAQTLAPAPYQTFLDNSGKVVNGGCVWTYLAGTSTPADTYNDADLAVGHKNANPIKADSSGRFVTYLTNGVNYKFVYENIPCTAVSHGTTLKTVDNIRAVPTNDVTSLRDLSEGRLTLTSGTPVTTADVTAATSIFYTPYVGNRVALYDGTASWNVRTFSEVTISIAACTASRPYDVWLYDVGGTVTGEILAWTNSTTRATGLTRQDGIYVKSGDATRRYEGTFYCNSTGGQTDDTAAKRDLSNFYNRVRRPLLKANATASWTYTLATVRQANNDPAQQVEAVIGVAEVSLVLNLDLFAENGNAGSVVIAAGIGEDSTTTFAAGQTGIGASVFTGNRKQLHLQLIKMPAVGRHVYSWNEWSTATNTTTWYTDIAGFGSVNGLNGSIED